MLRDELVPRIFAGTSLDAVRGNHPARVALSGAVLDAQLRMEGVSLASHLGGARTHVPAGVAIGLLDDASAVAALAANYVGLGYRSLKLKIAPGHDVTVVSAVRAEIGPGVTLQIDANGSYELADADRLVPIDTLDVACFEQPLAPDALVDHAAPRGAVANPARSGRDDHERARRARCDGFERV